MSLLRDKSLHFQSSNKINEMDMNLVAIWFVYIVQKMSAVVFIEVDICWSQKKIVTTKRLLAPAAVFPSQKENL